MADLSNLKIKDTYQLLLQADASGNLQNLQGATPNPFIVNGNLRYVDGNQQADYYLKSDGTGNATWAQVTVSGDIYISAATMNDTVLQLHTTSGTTINVPVSYWSTDGSGNYSNSGLTGNIGIGTATPKEKLTVVGTISGSSIGAMLALSAGTDLYLGGPSGPYTASTISAEETLTMKGRRVDNDYMILKKDSIDFHLDGLQAVRFVSSSTGATPNTGAFQFNTSGKDYDFKIIGEDKPIFQVTSSEHKIRIRDHLTIGPNNSISHADSVLWGLAVTGSSLFYSGGTVGGTNFNAIEAMGNVTVSGDIKTTNLILAADGYIMPATSSNTVKMRAQNYDGEMISIGPDLFQVNMNTASNLTITPTQVTFNAVGIDQDFQIKTDSGNFTVQNNAEFDLLALGGGGGTSIGGLATRWPTSTGFASSAPIQTLRVNGITTIYSGGPETYSWSADTTALTVVGNTNITGALSAHTVAVAGTIYSGASKLENLFLTQSGLSGSSVVDKVGTITTNQFAVWSDSDKTLKSISNLRLQGSAVTGDIISGTTLSAATINASRLITSPVISTPTLQTPSVTSMTDIIYTADSDGDEVGQHIFKDRTTTLLTVDETGADFTANITASGSISGTNISATTQFTNDIYLPDNGQAIFGDGSDLKIYHSGSHSIIQEAGVGNLLLKGGAVKIMGTTTGEDCAVFTENAGVDLYFNDSNKFSTTNTGVNITGNLSSSATVSGATLQGMRAFPNPNLTDHSHMGDVIYLETCRK